MVNPLATYVRLYRDAVRGLPASTWILALVGLVNRAGTMVVPFLTLYFHTQLGYTKAEAGGLFAVWGCGGIVGAYLGGWLSDRFGSVLVQVVTLVGSGLGFFALSQCEAWLPLAVTLFAVGAVFSAFRPANATTLVATCPRHLRRQAVALHRLAINLGMAIGPATGGVLASIDYDWLFLVDGLVCIASGLLLAKMMMRSRFVRPTQEEVDAEPGVSPWRDRLFLCVLGITFVNALIMFQWFTNGPIFFADAYEMEEHEIGFVLGINPVLVVVFEMVIVHLLRRRPMLPWIGLGGLLLGGSTMLLPAGSGLGWCVIVVVIWTFGEMLESPLTGAFTANRAGAAHRGRYMGALNIAISAAAISGPLLGGVLYENYGATTMWLGTGALGVGAAGVAFWAARRVGPNVN